MIRTGTAEFLELADTIPVIDVRSPSEYENGHIPGAVNIPLFSNEERAEVGTRYKHEGSLPAIIEGLRLAGPSMHVKLQKALENARNGRLLVHCWRGGMRSEAMAWLFSLGGIETTVLNGGYKAYRNHILTELAKERKAFILGGMTGSGKTHILRKIREIGHQVIDLEALACHRGSAFGSLGQPSQPSTEQFVNDLYDEWRRLDPDKPVWLEDESRNIGTVFLPDALYNNMQKSPTIVLMMDIQTRLPRLLEEYSLYPPGLLKESVMKISKRLGGDNTALALSAIDNGDMASAVKITLAYYDKAYQYSIRRKNNPSSLLVETDTDDITVNALKVLQSAALI